MQNPCELQLVGIHLAQEDAGIHVVAEVSGDSQTTHHSFGDFVIFNMLVNTLDLLEILQVPKIASLPLRCAPWSFPFSWIGLAPQARVLEPSFVERPLERRAAPSYRAVPVTALVRTAAVSGLTQVGSAPPRGRSRCLASRRGLRSLVFPRSAAPVPVARNGRWELCRAYAA